MTKSNPKEAVKTATIKTLSKYSTKQLQDKMTAGLLVGLSKEVAEEIIQKRLGSSIPTPKVGWTKDSSKFGGDGSEYVTKEVKVIKEKRVRASDIELINESLPEVKTILDQDVSKTAKIIALLKLNFSPLQIAKSSLQAHPSFCHTIKSKIKNNEKTA